MSANRAKLAVVGSFIVDLFYNSIYKSAKTQASDYTEFCTHYISAIKSDAKLTKRLVNQVYDYYKEFTHNSQMNFNDFAYDVSSELLPKKLKKPPSDQAREELVTGAIYELLTKMGVFMTSAGNIKNVIENRTPEVAGPFTESCREQSVSILLGYRTKICNLYMEKTTGIKSKSNPSDNLLLENCKKAIQRLVSEKVELQKKLDKAERKMDRMMDEINRLRDELENDDQEEDDFQQQQPMTERRVAPGNQNNRGISSQPSIKTDNRKPQLLHKVDTSFFSDSAPETKYSGSSAQPKEEKNDTSPNFNLPGDNVGSVSLANDTLEGIEKLIEQTPIATPITDPET